MSRMRNRQLYTQLRETSDGYTGRELMERKKDGTLFLVVSEEINRVPVEYWDELEGDSEEILNAWDNGGEPYPIEVYTKSLLHLNESKPGIRINEDVHAWLFNHRTTKEPTISDVVRGLIAQKESDDETKLVLNQDATIDLEYLIKCLELMLMHREEVSWNGGIQPPKIRDIAPHILKAVSGKI